MDALGDCGTQAVHKGLRHREKQLLTADTLQVCVERGGLYSRLGVYCMM